MNKLIKLFKTSKVTQKITSVIVAFAMLLSLNYTFAFGCINVAKSNRKGNTTHALYSATTKTYNFNNDASLWNNAYVSGDSGSRSAVINQNLVDFKDKNEYQPERFFYGTSTSSTAAAGEPSTTGTDNYAAYIALTDYNVARKTVKSGEYQTVKDNSTEQKEHNVIYIYPKSTDNLESAEKLVEALNNQVGYIKYKLQDTNKANGYEDNIYSTVDAEHMSAEYKDLIADIDAVNKANKEANDAAAEGATLAPIFDSGLYKYNLKSKFDYSENYMYFRTLSSIDGGLASNSYYAVSVWVYTKGDATATLRVNSDNGYIDAKITNITTNGVWQQYYLFIETRAAEACSRVYVYLYYGDENGVTGNSTLNQMVNSTASGTDDNGEEYKIYNTITGSVYFDNLEVHKINRTEYQNKTINGIATVTRATASLGKNYSIASDDNGKEGIVYISDYNTKNIELSPEPTIYTARNYSTINKFSGYDFNNSTSFTANDEDYTSIVNQTLTGDELYFDSYITNNDSSTASPFTYYIPRYTTDTNTTPLSSAVRNQYRRLYTGDTRLLDVSIVKEATALGTYQDYKRDNLGNLLDESGNIVTDTTKAAKTDDLPINTFGADNNVLRLVNKDTDYTLGVATTAIRIAQQSFYRISVWAYSSDEEAIATAKVIGNIKTGTSLENGTQVLASVNAPTFSTPEKATDGYNGWTEIVFYVKGNNYNAKDVYLVLQASSNSTVYYDNIKVEAVSSSAYTNATSGKVDLSSYGTVTGNITDGYFNNYSINGNDSTYTYPYAASSWSTDTKVNEGSAIAGIITTKESIYSQQLVAAKTSDGTIDYIKDGEYTKSGNNLIVNKGVMFNGKALEADTTFQPASNYTYANYQAGTHYYLTDNNGNYVKATTLKDMFGSECPVSEEYGEPRPAGNVYAINFTQEDSSYYITSSSIGHSLNSTSSLSANNVYKITFQAWFTTNFKGTFVANLRSGSNNIANIEYKVDNSISTLFNTWQTFTIYVRTGGASVSSITLQLGAKDAYGSMFIQDVDHKVLGELTDKTTGKKITASEQFDKALSATSTISSQNSVNATSGEMQIVKFVDFKDNNFTAYGWSDENGVHEALSYKQEKLDDKKACTQGKLGIIDTDGIDEFTYKYTEQDTNEGAASDATVDKELVIPSPANNNSATSTAMLLVNTKATDYTLATVQTGFSNSLASNSYYKISVDVKTSALGDNGLRIIANGIAAESFNNINTYSETDSGYKTYTYYVHTGTSAASNFSLSFQLGNDTGNSFIGWALVSNLQVNTITEDEYTQETSDETRDKQTTIIKNLATTGTNSSSNSKDENKNKFNWGTFFLVLSSILLVAALAIAIIGTVVIHNSKKLKAGEAGIVSADPAIGNNNKEGIN